MLPTFRYACTYKPVFLQTYLRALRDSGALDEDGARSRHLPALRRRHEHAAAEGRSWSVLSLNDRALAVSRQLADAAEAVRRGGLRLRERRHRSSTAASRRRGSLEAGPPVLRGLPRRPRRVQLRELHLDGLVTARRRGEREPPGRWPAWPRSTPAGRSTCAADRGREEVLRHGLGTGAGAVPGRPHLRQTSTTATRRTWPCSRWSRGRCRRRRWPSWVAGKCGVSPDRLHLLVAPTASIVGSVQVAARIVETGTPQDARGRASTSPRCAPASAPARWRRSPPTTSRPSVAPTTACSTAGAPGTRCRPTTTSSRASSSSCRRARRKRLRHAVRRTVPPLRRRLLQDRPAAVQPGGGHDHQR